MVRYETLILAHPEISEKDEKKLQDHFEGLASSKKCELISFDKWGKYMLTYPVKKQDYGIYYLVRYSLDPQEVQKFTKELQEFFRIRCSEFVMRYLNKRLAEDAPLEYQKPLSIEAAEAEMAESPDRRGRPYDRNSRRPQFDRRDDRREEKSSAKKEVKEETTIES